ncbi:MAG TPA: chemotaxis protein CheW [Gemmataceae bacterium]|jgi:chemotaxis-related protein WspB
MLALIFQIGNERFALDVRLIQEVVPRVPLQALCGAPTNFAGAFVYRGQVVPVIDLHRLAGAGDCPLHLSSRIILVPQPGSCEGRLLGLLASRVADLQDLQQDEQTLTRLHENGKPDFGPVLADRHGMIRLLDLDRLLPALVAGPMLSLERREP